MWLFSITTSSYPAHDGCMVTTCSLEMCLPVVETQEEMGTGLQSIQIFIPFRNEDHLLMANSQAAHFIHRGHSPWTTGMRCVHRLLQSSQQPSNWALHASLL